LALSAAAEAGANFTGEKASRRSVGVSGAHFPAQVPFLHFVHFYNQKEKKHSKTC
jgi:hypothetical protein